MEYLSDLDQAARTAFGELCGGEELTPKHLNTSTAPKKPHRRRKIPSQFLLKLDGPISTPKAVASAACLHFIPRILTGTGESGTVEFCQLDQSSLGKLELWLSRHHPSYHITKIRLAIAHKDEGVLPRLGVDPTLPQHRPDSYGEAPVSPTEYPVWYFFYGTLANANTLTRLLDLRQSPKLMSAVIRDGMIRTWAGKYKALVDKPGAKVEGWAYQVAGADQEEALRMYEGENYEVVKVDVSLNDMADQVKGFAFRYVGYEDELDL